ncbi:UvrD-helicase domain-containing protein [Halorussus aquaticus]|nr:UvrD-helicase domain-containing protein [Halorussus aquaticus]
MDSHPGAGKSTVTGKALARLLYDRYLRGDPTPERRILAASFSREDAADIAPDVVDWLWELYHRGETPTDESVTVEDVRTLERHLRQDGTVGTIDGVLLSVFEEFAAETGFDGMPVVGNEALLARLRRDCYEELAAHPDHGDVVAALEDAYPEGTYDDGLRELLRDALDTSRQRCLSTEEFCDQLRTAVADIYEGGDSDSVEAIRDAVRRFRGPDAAGQFDELSDDDLEELTAADRELHAAWVECVENFRQLLTAYRDRYDDYCRERGVLSHTDCAYWVDRYFTESDGETCERVRDRFRTTVESVVVDEAQDVSTVQHAALSHVVTSDMRVLLVGDRKQSIYVWRSARPSLFETAVRDGEYFGIDWNDHLAERATRNYRSRPDIVHAINAVARETLPDETRGNVGTLDVEYPPLRPTLANVEAASVHVAQFRHGGVPGSEPWVTDDGGEADAVATLLAGGFEDGTFETPGDDSSSVTLLFRRKKHMDDYREALEARGISVGHGRVPLFDSPAVQSAVAVLRWLEDPTDPDRTEDLVTASPLADGLEAWTDRFREADWCVETVAADLASNRPAADTSRENPGVIRVVRGLVALASDLPRRRAEPAAVVARQVVDVLSLARDPLGIDVETDHAQRLATLDMFVHTVAEWEGDDRFDLDRLTTLLDPFVASPQDGPDRPLVDDDADVVLKTIHQMKGDQDEVIVLADPAASIGPHPRQSDRLVTTGETVGLAPPTNVDTSDRPSIPGFDNGLYDPDSNDGGDVGLRWTAEHWRGDDLVNYPVLRDAAAERRAEAWRLLFVAMSRAQHHFVVPLPASRPRWTPRDNWAGVLYDALELDRSAPRATHTVTPDAPVRAGDRGGDPSFRVAVNDVAFTDRVGTDNLERPIPPTSRLGGDSTAWIPRFVQPSTFRPLANDASEHAIDHFMGRALHTETDAPEVGLPFDTLGPDTIGQLAHDVVGELATTRFTGEIRPDEDPVATVVRRNLDYHAADASPVERTAVREFLETTVVPQFAASGLRERAHSAATVYLEEPLEGLATVDGVEVEIQGQADFLMRFPDGSWSVEDVKIALTDDDAAEGRYQLQLATYEWALSRQVGTDAEITSYLSTFGTVTEETRCSLNPSAVEHCLGRFVR